MDGSITACHVIIAPAFYAWNLCSIWKLNYSDLCYGYHGHGTALYVLTWDIPNTPTENSTSKLVGEYVVISYCGGSADGPLCDGACRDVCFCNLPSSLDMIFTEHLQHHYLIDHTHKNISFPWIVIVASWQCLLRFPRRFYYHNIWVLAAGGEGVRVDIQYHTWSIISHSGIVIGCQIVQQLLNIIDHFIHSLGLLRWYCVQGH